MTSEREVGVDPGEARCRVEPTEPLALDLESRKGGDTFEEVATIEAQRRTQQSCRLGGTLGHGFASPPSELLEAQHVDVRRLAGVAVGIAAADDRTSADEPAQRGDVHLQGVARRGRRILAPQRADKTVDGHRVAGPAHQDRKHRRLAGATEGVRAFTLHDRGVPQQEDMHGVPPNPRLSVVGV